MECCPTAVARMYGRARLGASVPKINPSSLSRFHFNSATARLRLTISSSSSIKTTFHAGRWRRSPGNHA